MTDSIQVITPAALEKMRAARKLIDQGKIELDKARRAGLTEVVSKMEKPLSDADKRLRQLESVYR